jgi:hypothetical protein
MFSRCAARANVTSRGGKRRGGALGQLEIRGVVDGKAMAASQGQYRRFLGRAIDDDRQTR